MDVPKVVFIIPYRNRAVHKVELLKNMDILLDGHKGEYAFFFAHQCNKLPFNRGAMKNIGFLAIKNKYPDHYKNMAFIFHDVDSWPREKGLIDYMTLPEPGFVRHFYGYQWCLGGMFSIRGADFEKTGGFPNFWGWGLEDNVIHERCIKAGLVIDRRCFYKDIRSPYRTLIRWYGEINVEKRISDIQKGKSRWNSTYPQFGLEY